jgi:YVTN family beta-propeller protein
MIRGQEPGPRQSSPLSFVARRLRGVLRHRLLLLCALLSLVGCRQATLDTQKYAYREYVYVTNGGSNDVSVIDGLNFQRIATIPVGKNPSGVAANPKKNEIYVVNAESNNVSVVNAEKNQVVATIGVHRKPFFISVSADGTRGYVANSESNNVSAIDLVAHKVIATTTVGVSPGIASVSPDGGTVLATLRGEDAVAVLEATPQGLKMRAKIPACKQPGEVVIVSESNKAFVACSGGSQVAVLQLRKSGISADDKLLALLDVGKTPIHLALKPDGGEIFVSNFDSGTFSEIATNTNDVGGSYLIGSSPVRGLVANDNATLYVTDFNSDSVAIYDITINRLLATVHVGNKPEALALSPNQNYLFVVDSRSGDVAVIRTAVRALFTMIPVGRQPNAMVLKAFAVKR